jgi:CRISPR/Cas system CMR-associated protein Cmr5 small subunit
MKKILGKVKYIGKDIYPIILNNGIYDVVGFLNGNIEVIDNSDYQSLLAIKNPCDLSDKKINGKWEIVEDKTGIIKKKFDKYL